MKIIKTPRYEGRYIVPCIFGIKHKRWILGMSYFLPLEERIKIDWYAWYKHITLPERKIMRREDN